METWGAWGSVDAEAVLPYDFAADLSMGVVVGWQTGGE